MDHGRVSRGGGILRRKQHQRKKVGGWGAFALPNPSLCVAPVTLHFYQFLIKDFLHYCKRFYSHDHKACFVVVNGHYFGMRGMNS